MRANKTHNKRAFLISPDVSRHLRDCYFLQEKYISHTFYFNPLPALPKGELRIEGLAPEYLEGEPVNVDCVSELADPAPILSWYINGHQVSDY